MNKRKKRVDISKDTTPLVLIGDVEDQLKRLPPKRVDVIVTSPPYYKQREYGAQGEIGQEKTPEDYVKRMVKVAGELRRVLKDTGSYFLNVGDKFIDKKQQLIPFKIAAEMQKNGWIVRNLIVWHKFPNPMPTSIKNRFNDVTEPIIFFVKDSGKYFTYDYYFNLDPLRVPPKTDYQPDLPLYLSEDEYEKLKDKIPQKGENRTNSKFVGHEKNRGASPGARMVLYGEYYTKQRKHKIDNKLETKIIQYLRNQRKRRKITLSELSKKTGIKKTTIEHWFRLDPGRSLPSPEDWMKLKSALDFDDKYDRILTEQHYILQTVKPHPKGRNPGNLWKMAPGKLKEAHFSIFPEELPRRVIQVACPPDGIVLDPFAGSGTTGKVAKELGRRSILIDIKKDYVGIMRKRCGKIKEV